MNQATTNDKAAGSEDIIFECPQCGKSLEIDARGAGYIVVCPDCKNEIQVPAWESSEPAEDSLRSRVHIEDMLHLLQAKVARLEKKQQADEQCFKRLADEIVLIQSALDRVTEIVESRQAES